MWYTSRRMIKYRRFAALCLLITLSAGVFGADVAGVEGFAGLLWIGNMEEEGGPSPLVPTFGVSVPLDLGTVFDLETRIGVFGQLYEWIPSLAKAVPTEVERADSVYFLGILLDPGITFNFDIGADTTLGLVTSAALLLRIPTVGYGAENFLASLDTDIGTNRGKMTGYLYGPGRFFYPRLGVSFARRLASFTKYDARLTAGVSSYWPLFHLWDGERPSGGPAVLDQLIISGTLGLRFFPVDQT